MKSKLKAQRTDIILFSIAVAFTVIGVHQVMVNGIARSYWIFMLVFTVLIIYNIRKKNLKDDDEDECVTPLENREIRRNKVKGKPRTKD